MISISSKRALVLASVASMIDQFNMANIQFLNEVYVKCIGFRMIRLPFFYYMYVVRPILVGLLPHLIYKMLRK